MCFKCDNGLGGICTTSGMVISIPRDSDGKMMPLSRSGGATAREPHLITGQLHIKQPPNADTPRRTEDWRTK